MKALCSHNLVEHWVFIYTIEQIAVSKVAISNIDTDILNIDLYRYIFQPTFFYVYIDQQYKYVNASVHVLVPNFHIQKLLGCCNQ